MGGKALGGRKVEITEAENIYRSIVADIVPFSERVMLCGSARRGKKLLGDMDIVYVNRPQACGYSMDTWLTEQFGLKKNGKPQNVGLIQGVQVEFYPATIETWGTCILMWTGSMWNNIKLRKRAKKYGFKLSQHGLFDGDVNLAANKTECQVFELLNAKYLKPEER